MRFSWNAVFPSSWPGIAVRRTASLPLAYAPAIHAFSCAGSAGKTWIPGTRPGMTEGNGFGTRGRAHHRSNRRESILQEFAGLVERAEGNAGLRKGLGRAFVAVHHGEHQRDLAAGLAHRFDRFQR